MTPSAIYDIFKKKFQGLTETNFVSSYKQDRTNTNGIYLNSRVGQLYFYYNPKKDTWMLTNDVRLKNAALQTQAALTKITDS